MNRLVIIASLFALAAPAALAASPADKPEGSQAATPSASDVCKQQRNTIGMDTFRALHAQGGSPKLAMENCLKSQGTIAVTAAKNAAKACKAEQADQNFATAHGKTFAAFYGKNDNDKNAYGKCVSAKAKENVEAQQQATLNAARKCKAERASWSPSAGDHAGKSFNEYYGTNKNKRNAFGKCVSRLAKEQND